MLGQPVVVRHGRPARSELRSAARFPVGWKIVADAGVVAEGETSDRVIHWPEGLPAGVYRLQLTDAADVTEDVPLISAPEKAFAGDFDRCWLLGTALRRPLGAQLGDRRLHRSRSHDRVSADLGADGIGLNPLHALFDDRPGDCSPYSPNSRLFLNALYVDVDKVA